MQKDFPGWHRHKERLHAQHHTPTFQEREIWWCSVGVNVGHEMDGKNQFYNRPVLIMRKFNPHIFFGVPLTTKMKQNPYYLQYLRHLSGVDRVVDPPKCSHLGHHLINTNGIGIAGSNCNVSTTHSGPGTTL